MGRYIRLIVLFVLLSTFMATAQAQDAVVNEYINIALTDLSQRLGTTVGLSDFADWQWEQRRFPDTSLDCPAPGQAYTQTVTSGYVFTLTDYDNKVYDYRVSSDKQIVILCVNGSPAGALPPTATPDPSASATPIPPLPCDFAGAHSGYMPTRLAVGREGRVLGSYPNNVRSEPNPATDLIIQIPAGETFKVLAGPMCLNNMVWWQVEYKGYDGWTAEGKDGEYWVEPAIAAPAPTNTPQSAPPSAPHNAPPSAPQSAPAPLADGRTAITVANSGKMVEQAMLQQSYPITAPVIFGGEMVISGGEDGTVTLWDIKTGTAASPPLSGDAHSAAITMLAYTKPDADALGLTETSPLLASGDANGVVVVWDLSTRTEANVLMGHTGAITDLAFSRDGSLLASGSADGTVRLWNALTGEGIAIITAHTDAIVSLTFNEAGTLLVSASADGITRVWGLPQ